jgi:hypothetical protein
MLLAKSGEIRATTAARKRPRPTFVDPFTVSFLLTLRFELLKAFKLFGT